MSTGEEEMQEDGKCCLQTICDVQGPDNKQCFFSPFCGQSAHFIRADTVVSKRDLLVGPGVLTENYGSSRAGSVSYISLLSDDDSNIGKI